MIREESTRKMLTASKGRRREMEVITDMHSLQARARGIGGSGLDDGLSGGTEGRRRGEPGDFGSNPRSPSTSISQTDMGERKVDLMSPQNAFIASRGGRCD